VGAGVAEWQGWPKFIITEGIMIIAMATSTSSKGRITKDDLRAYVKALVEAKMDRDASSSDQEE